MLNTVIGLLIAVVALVSSGCGKAPTDLSSVNTVTAAPAVTQAFTYTQATQICSALENWDSSKTNIQFPGDPASNNVYVFTASKITLNNYLLTDYVLHVAVSGTTYCTVTLTGGKMVSCQ